MSWSCMTSMHNFYSLPEPAADADRSRYPLENLSHFLLWLVGELSSWLPPSSNKRCESSFYVPCARKVLGPNLPFDLGDQTKIWVCADVTSSTRSNDIAVAACATPGVGSAASSWHGDGGGGWRKLPFNGWFARDLMTNSKSTWWQLHEN